MTRDPSNMAPDAPRVEVSQEESKGDPIRLLMSHARVLYPHLFLMGLSRSLQYRPSHLPKNQKSLPKIRNRLPLLENVLLLPIFCLKCLTTADAVCLM